MKLAKTSHSSHCVLSQMKSPVLNFQVQVQGASHQNSDWSQHLRRQTAPFFLSPTHDEAALEHTRPFLKIPLSNTRVTLSCFF